MNWKITAAGIFIVIMFSLIGIFFLKPIGFNKNGINPLESKNITKERKQTVNIEGSIMDGKNEAKEIKRDGNSIEYDNGVVYDARTGLEWFAGPDKNINWKKAKSWVGNLDVAGGGWRMPACDELKTLFRKGPGSKDIPPLSRNISPLFNVRGQYIWSREIGKIKGSIWSRWDASYFDYNFDGYEATDLFWFSSDFRCFAVRTHQTQTIMTAAHQRDLAAVKKMLDAGADVNMKDNEGNTVLMMTVKYNAHGQGVEQYKIVQLLVDRGANVNIKQKDGYTALDYAKRSGSAQVIKILKQNGAIE